MNNETHVAESLRWNTKTQPTAMALLLSIAKRGSRTLPAARKNGSGSIRESSRNFEAGSLPAPLH